MDFLDDVRQNFKIVLTNKQQEMFLKYFEKLVEFNSHTNLTTITEKTEVYYKHFFDSLTILKFIENKNSSLCDMGSGAGFPSIPLKIINPELKITIIDSANKRIKFLQELINELELDNVTLVHDRIEIYGQKNQQKFDIVTARALGSLNIITEMALPMLKLKGKFISMKGSKGDDELNDAQNAINSTGGKLLIRHYESLPHDFGERSIFVIDKIKHVSGYPRAYQQILKKPL